MKNWLIAFVALFVVTGCTQSSVPVQNLPEITFKHLKPIALDVAVIDVVDQSSDGMGGKHVEHLFPTAPKTAVHNWVRDRLVATGTSGSARVIINDASALEEKLKTTSGIKGVFTNDQSERYTTMWMCGLNFLMQPIPLPGLHRPKRHAAKPLPKTSLYWNVKKHGLIWWNK